LYWIRPSKRLSVKPGHHRFIWDLRYAPPRGSQRQLSITATYKNTPTGPQGPWVDPGKYNVRLVVDEVSFVQPISVTLDPRSKISASDLKLQSDYSLICYKSYHELQDIREAIDQKLNNTRYKWSKGKKEQVIQWRGSGTPDNPDVMYGSISEVPLDKETLVGLQDKLLHMMAIFQSADVKPTDAAIEAVDKLRLRVGGMIDRWKKIAK
jgi:hypothetical protein